MKQGYYFTGNETFKVNPNIINEIKQDYINGKETKSLLFKKYYRKYKLMCHSLLEGGAHFEP